MKCSCLYGNRQIEMNQGNIFLLDFLFVMQIKMLSPARCIWGELIIQIIPQRQPRPHRFKILSDDIV